MQPKPLLSKQKQEQNLKQQQNFKKGVGLALEYYLLVFLSNLNLPSNCLTFVLAAYSISLHRSSDPFKSSPRPTGALEASFQYWCSTPGLPLLFSGLPPTLPGIPLVLPCPACCHMQSTQQGYFLEYLVHDTNCNTGAPNQGATYVFTIFQKIHPEDQHMLTCYLLLNNRGVNYPWLQISAK